MIQNHEINDLSEMCLPADATARQAMQSIERNRSGVVLITDDAGRLIGTVTDGDIRRAILAQRSLESSVVDIMCHSPITAKPEDSRERVQELMDLHRLRQIPVADDAGQPIRLWDIRDLVHRVETFPLAVVMAGGEGQRLRPLTDRIPKPMVKVGDLPILENIVGRLVEAGIRKIYISVNYKPKVIEDYFQDGSRFGAEISYLREDCKLGTAGALALLPEPSAGPCLVINGDVLTNSNFSLLFEYHRRHHCVMTVGAVEYRVQVPYGVLKLADHYLLGIEEKPVLPFMCNAGIYVLNPEVLELVPKQQLFDMTDLLGEVLNAGLPVAAYPIHEYWLDIGQHQDLEKAREEFPMSPMKVVEQTE